MATDPQVRFLGAARQSRTQEAACGKSFLLYLEAGAGVAVLGAGVTAAGAGVTAVGAGAGFVGVVAGVLGVGVTAACAATG